jgi:hypothetical protein
MAVHNLVPGLAVTICGGGQTLLEYENSGVEVEPGNQAAYKASRTVSKYVQPVTGHEFSIKMSLGASFNFDCPTLAFKVYVDGIESSLALPSNLDLTNFTAGMVPSGASCRMSLTRGSALSGSSCLQKSI